MIMISDCAGNRKNKNKHAVCEDLHSHSLGLGLPTKPPEALPKTQPSPENLPQFLLPSQAVSPHLLLPSP